MFLVVCYILHNTVLGNLSYSPAQCEHCSTLNYLYAFLNLSSTWPLSTVQLPIYILQSTELSEKYNKEHLSLWETVAPSPHLDLRSRLDCALGHIISWRFCEKLVTEGSVNTLFSNMGYSTKSSAVQSSAVNYSAVFCSEVRNSAVQCSAIHCNVV